MNADVVQLTREALWLVLILSAPPIVAASIVGLIVAFLQAATQLQEQTLTTVPRLLIVVTLILVALPWFARRLVSYTILLLNDFHRYLG